METPAKRHVLLTGPPGCGKTTVLRAALDLLTGAGWAAFGFWTPEVRRGRERLGFEARLVSGASAVLASKDWAAGPRVGSYRVRIEVMERLVVPEIERGVNAAASAPRVVVVMDEIGKMELLSTAFAEAVGRAFASRARVLATIMARAHPFAEALKTKAEVWLLTVTPENRRALPARIAEAIAGAHGNAP